MTRNKIYKSLKLFYVLIFLGVISFGSIFIKSYAKNSNQGLSNRDLSNRYFTKNEISAQGSVKRSKYGSIEEIDKKINELQDMKRGYESKAIRYDNQAQRLQFIEGELQNAKMNWKLAEDNRKIATRIQKEIDELKIERMKLQK